MSAPAVLADPAPLVQVSDTGALVVSELFPPDIGGSAVLFREIYRRVPGDVRVLTALRSNGPTQDGAIRILRHPIAASRWGLMHPQAALHHLRVARLVRRLVRNRPTVVHCGRALPEGISAMFARQLGGPPFVCWTHGEDLAMAETSRELAFLTRRVYANASLAFSSSWNTGRMLERIGVSADKIVVAHPGVDANRFSPSVSGSAVRKRFVRGNEILLVSVGRLQRRKGHDLAIAAVSKLQAEGKQVRYLIVGDGEERPRLERLVHEAGVAERVHFIGEVAGADLPTYFAAADVFVLPNRVDQGDIEGFGIVFLEAASSGRPVIAGNSGGVPEAVADGVTGLLVGGTDVAELVAAIRMLISDPDLRARFGEAGRRRVLEQFTWERSAAIIWGAHERVARHDGRSSC